MDGATRGREVAEDDHDRQSYVNIVEALQDPQRAFVVFEDE